MLTTDNAAENVGDIACTYVMEAASERNDHGRIGQRKPDHCLRFSSANGRATADGPIQFLWSRNIEPPRTSDGRTNLQPRADPEIRSHLSRSEVPTQMGCTHHVYGLKI